MYTARLSVLGCLLAAATLVGGPSTGHAQTVTDPDDAQSVYVDLDGSQRTGVAVLFSEEGKTVVTLLLDDEPNEAIRAQVRRGTCASPSADTLYALNATDEGYSDTILDVKLESLLSTPTVITVPKAAGDGYASCGEIIMRDEPTDLDDSMEGDELE